MHAATIIAAFSLLASSAFALDSGCQCRRNDDGGRWIDSKRDPHAAVVEVTTNYHGGNPSCTKGDKQGTICVSGDPKGATCLQQYAQEQESYHGDWFLWTVINCNGLDMTMTV